MARIAQFTKNRDVIYDLLSRASRFHCTCASLHEFDVSELIKALEAAKGNDKSVSLNACLVKATGMVLRKYPRLNRHLFHGVLRKYVAEFENVDCNMIMARKDGGEIILLPLIIKNPDTLSVAEIHDIISYHYTTPLDELPQVQGIQRLKRLPRIALKYFSFKCRSDFRFYRKYFGTYGYSSMIVEDGSGAHDRELAMPTQAKTNTCIAFLPSAIIDRLVLVDGVVEPRKTLLMTVLMDHYLIDAHDVGMAIHYFQRLLGDPSNLDLG